MTWIGSWTGRRRPRLLGVVGALVLALVVVPAAWAGDDEHDLALKYAPEIRLKEQKRDCGPGEPYLPTNVGDVLGRSDVLLRGPWDRTNIVTFEPSAEDLAAGVPPGRVGFHLDFPGNALRPRCTYERWSNLVNRTKQPTAYARVVTEEGKPDQLALQYWFFYLYNNFNNKHEGDWEMIQLLFDVPDATAALREDPVRVGYSQHEGAEAADWGDDKLELAGGTHPAVYPAAGSHANYFRPALFLGRSAAQGVGCDNTTSPSTPYIPTIVTVPSDPEEATERFPWLAFEGHWGELRPGFYNGPTGPNTKHQWTHPITWAEEEWRSASFAVPAGGFGGPTATGFFCSGVGAGSQVLTWAVSNPWPVILTLLGLVGLLLLLAARTTWESSAPLRLARRRSWGQVLAASRRMFTRHFLLFLGIGVLFVPIFLLAAAAQGLVLRATRIEALVDVAGGDNPAVAGVALAVGSIFFLLAVTLVQAATSRAMLAIDQGRTIRPWSAYREVLDSISSLLGALLRVAVAVGLLAITFWLLPVAVFFLVRWSLIAQVVELEDRSAGNSLRRSSQLVRGDWFWTAAMTAISVGFAVVLGLLVGAALLFTTGLSFELVNLVTAVVYAVLIPIAAIITTYVYFDLRVNEALRPEHLQRTERLPAELEVGDGRGAPEPAGRG